MIDHFRPSVENGAERSAVPACPRSIEAILFADIVNIRLQRPLLAVMADKSYIHVAQFSKQTQTLCYPQPVAAYFRKRRDMRQK